MTGIDDEAIQANENLLLTFKNVRNELGKGNKIFKRATKASLDLSKAGFGSLDSAAKMLGKALNDPERGMTALGRAGVTFTKQQKETIKDLIASNRLLDAQKIILAEVESQVGGSAKAYGSTFPGALSKLRNAFENVTGALAEGLAPVIKSVAKDLTTKLADPRFVDRIRELGKEIGEKLRAALISIGTWFRDHWDEIKTGFRVAGELAQGTAKAVGLIADAMKNLLKVGAPIFKVFTTQFKLILALASGLAGALSALPFVGGKFKGAADAIDKIREGIRGFERGLDTLTKSGAGPSGVGPFTGRPAVRGRAVPRAHGGPVMPGIGYRVGERGPETFVPNRAGMIVPNGGGGTIVIPVYLDGREIARVVTGHQQRAQRSNGSQTRGRFGGNAFAFG
jgi:hypothetical protein